MAQDLLDRFTPLHTQPISGSPIATWSIVSGHRALKVPQGGSTYVAHFASVLGSLYNNSGILVTLILHTAGVTAGMQFSVAFERQADGVFDYSGSSFATAKTLATAAPVASNFSIYSQLEFSNAEIDGLQALESYRLQVMRLADGIAQDAYLHRVMLQNLT